MQTKRNLKVQGQDSKSYGKGRHEVLQTRKRQRLSRSFTFLAQ